SGRFSRPADFRAGRAVFSISRRKGCHPECVTRNICRTVRPLSRLIKLQRLLLTRTRLRLEIVKPTDYRRKTHQNRLGAAARLEPDNSATIVEEIEFHVA